MIELSKDQIEQAAKAAYEGTCLMGKWEKLPADLMQIWRDAVTAAAPYLQSPWAPPTEEEIIASDALSMQESPNGGVAAALKYFVARRNAELLPPPVDPRREKAIAAATEAVGHASGLVPIVPIVDAILAALDGKE